MFKKILVITVVGILAAYLVASMTILNKPDGEKLCPSVDICILDSAQTGFITAKEIGDILKTNQMHPKGKKMRYIDDRRIETLLRNTPFIKSAECYKTSNGTVRIELTQQLPILRIMKENGDSYYIDQSGRIMSSSKYTANVPIATGRISRNFAEKELKTLGLFISKNDFWEKQIEQINVLPSKDVEIIPRIGDHVIYLGKVRDVESKFNKLHAFYHKVLNKVGWNKYSRINLEFSNQIICTKR